MRTSLPRDVVEVVLRLCEDANTPISLSVAILIRYKEWDQISVKKLDPGNYVDPARYRKDIGCVDLLRKLEDLPTTADRRKAAVDNFWLAEHSCYRTNERLSPFLFSNESEEGIPRFLALVRKKVSQILGRPPSHFAGRFGPGSTFLDKGQLTTVADKMSSRPTFTGGPQGAWPWLIPWASTLWAKACGSSLNHPLAVRGNRFAAVTKDCTKFRGIAIEPSINLFYQLGTARHVRKRLCKFGINLDFAQETHRRVAREASITGDFVTIDLTNASDTLCTILVKIVTSPSWWNIFSSLRSPFTFIDGRWVKLEKFSSMGNGFTFELETLIFLCIAASVMEICGVEPLYGVNVHVFGDDIIVPKECAREVIAALRFLGFSTNERKTFVEGPFRESCGGDYFLGEDVRPHYLKSLPYEPHEWIALANGLFRLGNGHLNGGNYLNFVHRARLRVLDAIPSRIRNCRGPLSLGDLVIHDRDDRGTVRWRSGIRYWRVWRPARFRYVGWHHFKDDVILACACYGAGDGARGFVPRSSVLGYKLGWVPYS